MEETILIFHVVAQCRVLFLALALCGVLESFGQRIAPYHASQPRCQTPPLCIFQRQSVERMRMAGQMGHDSWLLSWVSHVGEIVT
jgi:hypothetical protein